MPEDLRETFLKEEEVTHNVSPTHRVVYMTLHRARKATINSNATVRVSTAAADGDDYQGVISDLLSTTYYFSRKSKRTPYHTVSLEHSVPKVHKIISLVEARNRAREWANGRGDVEGVPAYFEAIARKFAAAHPDVEITVIKGQELLEKGFRLLHAVGRGSINEPIFVNLAYKGNPTSEDWVAFVGKGVCFDTGGYNIKTTSGIKDMFLDKHGATSVLSAFEAVVEEKLAVNITCSIGLVENFISDRAYRPSDIIISRKGLSVEIGNTDA